ncbi:MAG: D-lyxose/D-mannose family sugar isomerase [Verrucomicrobiales bacterium]|nr:D-lyxose/D-mannose family sugar isomerase [Verrucomicrobiales bacterium]
MNRSEINHHIREAEALFASQHFHLPPFASWTPDQWQTTGPEADEIRRCALGWDLSDYGLGDFSKTGLLLFTVRNGDHTDPASKTYAEKIMVVRESQVTPWHFHWKKTEDIINRGTGQLTIELAWATTDESALDEQKPVTVSCDGIATTVPALGTVTLDPGQSITLPPFLYHQFYGTPGHGTVLVGEVSSTNDDKSDNRFLAKIGRFPTITEDENPHRLLCTEYPSLQ